MADLSGTTNAEVIIAARNEHSFRDLRIMLGLILFMLLAGIIPMGVIISLFEIGVRRKLRQ